MSVCCQQGLQFFPDPAAATREVWRVLAANGRLVLAMWRPVEHNSVFGPFIEAIEAHAGDSAAGTMRSPFSGPSIETLRTMLSEAEFEPVRAMVEVVRVRFPSVDEYVRREVLSSPLVGPIGDLRPDARDAFLGDVRTRLQPWVDDKGLGFTMRDLDRRGRQAPRPGRGACLIASAGSAGRIVRGWHEIAVGRRAELQAQLGQALGQRREPERPAEAAARDPGRDAAHEDRAA